MRSIRTSDAKSREMQKLTKCRQVQSEHVTIVVDKHGETTTFSIPKALLCAKSTVVATAFKEDAFLEGATNMLRLETHSAAAFKGLVYYLYNEDLAFHSGDSKYRASLSQELRTCYQMWVLGDKYDLSGLSNCAKMRICQILKCLKFKDIKLEIPLDALALAFEETLTGSPLQKLSALYISERVHKEKVKIDHFSSLGSLKVFAMELFKAQQMYYNHYESGKRAPYYYRPLLNRALLRVDKKESFRAKYCGYWQLEDYWEGRHPANVLSVWLRSRRHTLLIVSDGDSRRQDLHALRPTTHLQSLP